MTDEAAPALDKIRPRRRRTLRRTVTGVGLALVAMGLAIVLSPVEDEESRSCGSSPALLLPFDDDDGRGEPGFMANCRTHAQDQLIGGLILGTVGAGLVFRRRIARTWRRAAESLVTVEQAAEGANPSCRDLLKNRHDVLDDDSLFVDVEAGSDIETG